MHLSSHQQIHFLTSFFGLHQTGFTLFTGHEGPQGEQRYSSTLFQTCALEGGEGSASRPGSTLPPGKNRYPFYGRLGGSQGRSGLVRKISPHRDSIPDRPARRQSLYRLRYPAHPLDSPTQIKRYSYYMGVDVTVKQLNVINDKCPLCGTKIMRIAEAVTLKHKQERRFYGHSLIIAFSEL